MDNSATPKKRMSIKDAEFTYEMSKVFEYVLENKELFGENVIIYDSPDMLIEELNALNNMDYIELRKWQSAHRFCNDVINSIIIHDSVQTNIYGMYGIKLFRPTEEINDEKMIVLGKEREQVEDLAFEKYDEIMKNEYSKFVKETKHDDGTISLSPLGGIDIYVIFNQKNVFVCGDLVFRQLLDGVVSCPYDLYTEIATCNYIEDVQKSSIYNYVQIIDIRGDNQIEKKEYVRKKTFKDSEFDNNPKYRMTVTFGIDSYKTIFGFYERRDVSMNATNEHKNKDGSYRYVACETKINANVTTTCAHSDDWKTSIKTGWCPMRQYMFYTKTKYYSCVCFRGYFTHIEVNARNIHGNVIKEDMLF